jgi:hypothetical protein
VPSDSSIDASKGSLSGALMRHTQPLETSSIAATHRVASDVSGAGAHQPQSTHTTGTNRVMMSLKPTPTTAAHQGLFDAEQLCMKADSNDRDDGASETSDWHLRSFRLLTSEYSSSSSPDQRG